MFPGNKRTIAAVAGSTVLAGVLSLGLSACGSGQPAPSATGDATSPVADGGEPRLTSSPQPGEPVNTNVKLPEPSGHPNPVEGNTPMLVHFKEGTEAANIVANSHSEENPLRLLPESVRSEMERAIAQSYCRIESSKAIGANLRVQLNCMLNEAKTSELRGELEKISDIEWAEREQRGQHA